MHKAKPLKILFLQRIQIIQLRLVHNGQRYAIFNYLLTNFYMISRRVKFHTNLVQFISEKLSKSKRLFIYLYLNQL